MNVDIDPAKVLYAVGAVFGVAAVLYFARDIVFDLSITVRSLLLALAFVALLVGAMGTERDLIDVVLYVLSAAAYLAFLVYTLDKFEVGADGTFLALGASSVLFIALGYLHRERSLSPSPSTARTVVLAVVAVAALLVGVDLATAGVVYGVTVADEVDLDEGGGVVVGTATAENQFVFREPVEFPQAYACVYTPTRRERPVRFRGESSFATPDTVPAGGTLTVVLTTHLHDDETARIDGPIPVERADSCPDESDDPRIVVVVGDDGEGLPR